MTSALEVEIHTTLRSGSHVVAYGALARSGTPVARPAVVFFAVEPPLADAITTEVYQDLARQASVIWVMPADSVSLAAVERLK